MAFGIWHLALAAACAGREAPAPLAIAVGPPGSANEACGRAIAGLLSDIGRGSVTVTGGSVESLEALRGGRADLALATADTLARAVNGEDPFAGRTVSARTVATLYDNSLHLIVLDDSPLHGFSQLRNHTVGIGEAASGMDLTARRALGAALVEDRVVTYPAGFSEGISSLAARRLDALFWVDAVPSAALERAVRERGIRVRLLNTASVVPLIQRRYGASLYEASEIPAGTYGTVDRTDAVAVPVVLVSRHDLAEGTGYAIARTLFDRLAGLVTGCPAARGLASGIAARSEPAALHAGAARFYRESGVSGR